MFQEFLKSFYKHYFWFWFSVVMFLLLITLLVLFLPKVYAGITEARQQEIQIYNANVALAIEKRDYKAYTKLQNNAGLESKLTPENFRTFADIYTLLEVGKIEEANLLKKNIDLKEDIRVTEAKSAAITDAIKNRDYNAWTHLVGEEYAQNVKAEDFSKYSTFVDSVLTGKPQEVESLKAELGFGVGQISFSPASAYFSEIGTTVFDFKEGDISLSIKYRADSYEKMVDLLASVFPKCDKKCAIPIVDTAGKEFLMIADNLSEKTALSLQQALTREFTEVQIEGGATVFTPVYTYFSEMGTTVFDFKEGEMLVFIKHHAKDPQEMIDLLASVFPKCNKECAMPIIEIAANENLMIASHLNEEIATSLQKALTRTFTEVMIK